MDIDSIIGIASFILSLTGAIVSCWQAHKAKKIKDEIIDERTRIACGELNIKANLARNEINKLLPQIQSKQTRGFSNAKTIPETQTFFEMLNDNVILRNQNYELEKYFQDLKKTIESYNKNQIDNKQGTLNSLYATINNVIQCLKKIENTYNIYTCKMKAKKQSSTMPSTRFMGLRKRKRL